MKYHVRTHLRALLILGGIACAVMSENSQACNVPVFRYAMERWPADLYQVLVYHQASSRGVAFELLQIGEAERDGNANYSLKSVDVTEPAGKALAEQRGISAYPWVEIYYPIQSRIRTPVWSGRLTLDGARKILGSPARTRLAKELLSGDVAVWVLIKSGHDAKDRRALESLKSNLDWAAATLEIPETGVDVNGNPVEITDFKTYPVRFSFMEIARDDPKEALLVSALLESESDLGEYDEPLAFPVFGKGRALYALVGNGIEKNNIREACESILGWCSCEIKDQNPGTDLLISADWSHPLGGRTIKDPELPLTGLSSFLEDEPAAETAVPWCAPEPAAQVVSGETAPAGGGAATVASSVPASPPLQAPGPVLRNLLYMAGAAGLVLLSLSVFLTVKARR